jgi:hypothetical protein
MATISSLDASFSRAEEEGASTCKNPLYSITSTADNN